MAFLTPGFPGEPAQRPARWLLGLPGMFPRQRRVAKLWVKNCQPWGLTWFWDRVWMFSMIHVQRGEGISGPASLVGIPIGSARWVGLISEGFTRAASAG